MRPAKLSPNEIEQRLASLPGWRLQDARLHRTFRFADFSAAFAFMTRAALRSEQLDHHPEWSNVYNRVDVALTTHDAGGVTVLDFVLAEAMERFAAPQ
ncbi:MAG: 4a-hydroxytetrahydrobiopterin dehydratase [Gammaproteobacteria bacterium]|jgi:4a-hydroxytetrahydrobiopterin dehydratase|nr:4a-hydroxytetrahydrobiopterin dehydratase [Gammaproteobacteria bacterium]MBP6050670.1 4a-hydroxytetrahydrobiopterin dehydratase [Pseudomonadales bacterium]MBK6585485.1 4a-hydroxytetrahydrobiopterin dehydratase [Gammaproteobacteria bacterium]MBK7168866.1 4a-hydroxytetrahydrobiopterin dehydratase [Gammaproteobacteria bacterium]MBK7521020.1 4a-hydroxytetrahydrobiopterin dehydratase [Gammaproteobacteria bacterium]